MDKFKVGDIVIGNESATSNYQVTTEGHKGKVIWLFDDGSIQIESLESGNPYIVKSGCFDLYNEAPKKKSSKFKVGDIVIGNELANNYVVTIQGWKGEVIKVVDVEEGETDICVKNLTGPEMRWVRSECFDLYDPPKETKETVEVDVDFIKKIYEEADPYLKETIKEKFEELFVQTDTFNFGEQFTLTTDPNNWPVFIGNSMAPKGLEGRCLILNINYDLEVTMDKNNEYQILIFRKNKYGV